MHGISVHKKENDNVIRCVIWGGRLVRALEIYFAATTQQDHTLKTSLSNIAKAPDWILDLASRPCSSEHEPGYQESVFVAVTAHNALLELTIHWHETSEGSDSRYMISCS